MLGGVAKPVLAACGRHAWFGINHVLIELDSEQGVAERFAVPDGSSNAAVDAYRPDSLRGRSGITALACNDSTVAVGLSDAGNAFTFDVATRAFETIALPTSYEVASAAVTDKGTVAFGLRGYGNGPMQPLVLTAQRDPAAQHLVAVDDASVLTVQGENVLAGVGAQRVHTGVATGAEHTVPDAVAGRIDPLSHQAPVRVGSRVAYLDARTHRLMTVAADGTGTPKAVDLGTAICRPVYDRKTRTTVPDSPSGPCPVGIRQVVADGDGHLFVVPSNGSTVPVLQVMLPTD